MTTQEGVAMSTILQLMVLGVVGELQIHVLAVIKRKGSRPLACSLIKVDADAYAVAWLTICVSTLRHAST